MYHALDNEYDLCRACYEVQARSKRPGRLLKPQGQAPLQVTKIDKVGNDLVVSLANTTANTRVHVIAERFVHESAIDASCVYSRPMVYEQRLAAAKAKYLSMQQLSAEYRYILERQVS